MLTAINYKYRNFTTSKVACFISVDSLQFKYPIYTPFQYAGNKPISFIDLDGAEPIAPYEQMASMAEYIVKPFLNKLFGRKPVEAKTAMAQKKNKYRSKDDWGTLGVNAIKARYMNYLTNNVPKYTDNPAGSCIDIMNYVLSGYYELSRDTFLDEPYKGKTDYTSLLLVETVDYTAKVLNDKGYISNLHKIKSKYSSEYSYSAEIESLEENVVDVMIKMTNNKKGEYLFIISAGSGYHTTLMNLNSTGGKPIFTLYDSGNAYGIEMNEIEIQSFYLKNANYMEQMNSNERYGVTTNIYQLKSTK